MAILSNKYSFIALAIVLIFSGCGKKKEIRKTEEKGIVKEHAKTEEKIKTKNRVDIKTISVIGDAAVLDSINRTKRSARPNMMLKKDNILETEIESRMEVQLGVPENMLVMSENTRVSLSSFIEKDTIQKTRIDLPVGKIFVDVQKLCARNQLLAVKTPTALLAIRGTGFEVNVDEKTGATDVSVMEGQVEVRDIGTKSSVLLKSAETARVEPNKKPSKPRKINKSELVKLKEWIGPKIITNLSKRMSPKTLELLGISASGLIEKGVDATLAKVDKQSKQTIKNLKKHADQQIMKTGAKINALKDQKLQNINKQYQKKKNEVKKDIDKKVDIPVKTAKKKVSEKASKSVKKAEKKIDKKAKKLKDMLKF